jgi:hypothetical protein
MLGLAAAPLGSGFGQDTWGMVVDGQVLKPELDWEQTCVEAPSILKRIGKFTHRVGPFYGSRCG